MTSSCRVVMTPSRPSPAHRSISHDVTPRRHPTTSPHDVTRARTRHTPHTHTCWRTCQRTHQLRGHPMSLRRHDMGVNGGLGVRCDLLQRYQTDEVVRGTHGRWMANIDDGKNEGGHTAIASTASIMAWHTRCDKRGLSRGGTDGLDGVERGGMWSTIARRRRDTRRQHTHTHTHTHIHTT
jgi:hypothetical protein